MSADPCRRDVIAALGTVGAAGCLGGEPSQSSGPDRDDELDPPAVWRIDADGAVTTRPVVADGIVLVGDESGTITAVSESGTPEWEYDAGSSIRDPIAVEDGRLVAVAGENPQVGGDPTVHGVDIATGEGRWTVDSPSGRYLDLVATDGGAAFAVSGTDAVAPTGETMVAIDVEDGERRWTAEVGTPSFVAAVDDGGVYLRSADRVYAIDRDDGSERWHWDAERIVTWPRVTDGVVLVAARVDGALSLYGFHAASGERQWRFDEWPVASLVADDGTVFAGGRRVGAVDVGTGDPSWDVEGPGLLAGATTDDVVLAGGDGVAAYERATGRRRFVVDFDRKIVVARDANEAVVSVDTSVTNERGKVELFGVDPASGDRLWTFDRGVELTDSGVGTEFVFVGTADGYLYALGDEA